MHLRTHLPRLVIVLVSLNRFLCSEQRNDFYLFAPFGVEDC